jgi:hypothetical protein
VLLHGGTPRGTEKIAACWADARKVSQVVFKPDWTRHQKAAPFKRNDQLLEAMPIGVVVFPGSGVTDNLADKAKAWASRSSTIARRVARKRRFRKGSAQGDVEAHRNWILRGQAVLGPRSLGSRGACAVGSEHT